MIKKIYIYFLIFCGNILAQQTNITNFKDDLTSIVTDARSTGMGDIGVATSPDVFSQIRNPSKYLFSSKQFEIGFIRTIISNQQFSEFEQANFYLYRKHRNERSAIGLSIKNYSSIFINRFGLPIESSEFSVDGSYTLKLSNHFSMSVAGRFALLNGKVRQLNIDDSLFSVDVSGFYYGEEIGYKKFNGRWRAGFNFSNLRNQSSDEEKAAESYFPTVLILGTGFDFIFNHNTLLGVTSEYKIFLDSYNEDQNGQQLYNNLEGSIASLGLELSTQEKIFLRTGYSQGIDRTSDTFFSVGAGFKSKYADVDIAYIFGSDDVSLIRKKIRFSLILDVEVMLFGVK